MLRFASSSLVVLASRNHLPPELSERAQQIIDETETARRALEDRQALWPVSFFGCASDTRRTRAIG